MRRLFEIDPWLEILQVMRKNLFRTVLTAFGVFIGISLLVIMMGAGDGLVNGMSQNLGGSASNGVYVWGQRTTKPYAGLLPGRWLMLNDGDTKAILANVPDIEHLAPRLQLGGYGDNNNVSRGEETGSFSVMGDYPQFQYIKYFDILNGRFINDLDIDDKRRVCVIGDRVRKLLFPDGSNPVGQSIKIRNLDFKVVGVFNPVIKDPQAAQEEAETIYVPFTTFQHAFGAIGEVHWYAATAKEEVPATKIEEEIKAVLMTRHKVAPDDTRAFGSWNTWEGFKQMRTTFFIINLLVMFAGIGTLLAGIIGVTSIMLIVVKERTKEIGLRKAIGAQPLSIIAMIIQEFLVITLVAGLLGIVFGQLVVNNVLSSFSSDPAGDNVFFLNPSVDSQVSFIALGILLVVGTLFALIPASRAVAIDPIKALKTE